MAVDDRRPARHARPAHRSVRPPPAPVRRLLHEGPRRRGAVATDQRHQRRPERRHLHRDLDRLQRHRRGRHRRRDGRAVLAAVAALAARAAAGDLADPPGRPAAAPDHRRASAPARGPQRPDRGDPLGQRGAAHPDPRRRLTDVRPVHRDLPRPGGPPDPLDARRPLADGQHDHRLRRHPRRDLPRRRPARDVRRDDHRHARRVHGAAGHPLPPAHGPAERRRRRDRLAGAVQPDLRVPGPADRHRRPGRAGRASNECAATSPSSACRSRTTRRRPRPAPRAARHRPARPGRAPPSPSSARPAAARPPSPGSSPASTTRPRAGCWSTASTCATYASPTSPSVVGVVSQDTYLLHASVRDNLRHARPGATDAEIEEACRAARIHDVLAGLPDGYDTVVGARGHRFSGGEQQRLAIARTLLRDPAVLVLDEATSALDNETERAVQAALDHAARGPDDHHDRPPALDDPRRRPDRGPRPRPGRRARVARRAGRPRRPLRRPARCPRAGCRPRKRSGRTSGGTAAARRRGRG